MSGSTGMVKKWKIAPFLDTTPDSTPTWARIKKSTAFDLTLNPETQEYDYISDENPTTELLKYKPSLSQALTMYKGEDDYEYIFNMFYNLATGSAAESNILLAFFQEETEGTDGKKYFKAWKCKTVISVNDLNSVDSTISFDLFLNGTVEKGYVTTDEAGKPTWVAVLPTD